MNSLKTDPSFIRNVFCSYLNVDIELKIRNI